MSKNHNKTKTSSRSLTSKSNDVTKATNAMVIFSEPEQIHDDNCVPPYENNGDTPLLAGEGTQSGGLYIRRQVEKTKTKIHFNPSALVSGICGPIILLLVGAAMELCVPSIIPSIIGTGSTNSTSVSNISSIPEPIMNWIGTMSMIIGVICCITAIFKIAQMLMRGGSFSDGEELFWTEKVKAKPKEKVEQYTVKMPDELSQPILDDKESDTAD